MCYAIPGKVIEINNNVVTVDYFGERKKARNEICDVNIGDYIYAQGGFVIDKISAEEAQPILETWEEYFFKLQEIDLELTREPKNLYQIANATRQREMGNSCCVHGILEFSNYCSCNCLYCGIRKDNAEIKRYRMSAEEIISGCDYAVNKLGFKALVLQSGEDNYYDDKLPDIIKKIKEKCAVLLIISIGERDLEIYKKIYEAGARGVLLRFETSNEKIYKKIKPESSLMQRINLINKLKEVGCFIITGFLIGLPEQTEDDILQDIELTAELVQGSKLNENKNTEEIASEDNPDMFSFGPFIPHSQTPLANHHKPSLELILTAIARTRMRYNSAKIVVTTALETLDKENGAREGLMAGANSLMINITPEKYKKLYEIYPEREGLNLSIEEKIEKVLSLLHLLGRAPTDLGI